MAAREALERAALQRDPTRGLPHRVLAGMMINHLRDDTEAGCAGDGRPRCEQEFAEHVAAIQRAFPATSEADQMKAWYLSSQGKFDEGEHVLARRCDVVEDCFSCLLSRAQIAAGIKGSEPFASIAKQLMSAGCASPADCAAIAVLIGDLMANRGEWGGGTHYARSTGEEPTEARWLKLAQAAERVGAYVQVADALEKVGQLRGKQDLDLRQRIDENRAKAVHKLVDR